ncbi:MAG: sigma 54-interacting transcriptional regulator [Gammaproteobacteria bacterium]
MDQKVSSIELESLVNTHQKPFVIIDKNYRIIAANSAYEAVYGYVNGTAIGMKCHKVSHGNDVPCGQDGEVCPHDRVFASGEPGVCTHFHCDIDNRKHQVKISAYPLQGADGEMYLGECIEQISPPNGQNRRIANKRMVGDTPAFLACLKQLEVAASSEAPVLLQGETGTGKELAAEFIHDHSSRADKPFQIVDSTVLAENLFESEMFGHVHDAFTGSSGEKQGLFELAEGGSVFLDEIGDLPVSQQSKLLRVLESGQYRRLGGRKTSKADVRIICASNRQLWESVQDGSFREDLYYRIACLNIRLPALRERIDDVPTLARSLIEGINRSMRSSYHLHPDTYDELKRYLYPGNVRELRNVLFIAATHSRDREINAELIRTVFSSLPQNHHAAIDAGGERATPARDALQTNQSSPMTDTPASLQDIEAGHIRQLLARFNGNRKQVAEMLGVSERTIYRKLKKLGLS